MIIYGGNMVFLEILFVGLLALLLGAAFCFIGYRFFRILIPIWGFFAGFFFGAQGVVSLFGGGFLSTVTSWVIGLVVGLIFAALAYFFYYAAVVILGGSVGYANGRELLRRQNRSIPRFAAAELHDAAIRRDAAAASKFQPLEEQRDERRIAKRAVSGTGDVGAGAPGVAVLVAILGGREPQSNHRSTRASKIHPSIRRHSFAKVGSRQRRSDERHDSGERPCRCLGNEDE